MTKKPVSSGGAEGDGTAIGNELRGLPMEYLISAALAASTKAQVELGRSMVSFINLLAYGKEGVTAKPGAKAEDILTLPMKLERPVTETDGTISSHTITVQPPVLGLVPVPALLIETVDVSFSMEIHSANEDKTTVNAEAGVDVEAKAGGLFYSGSVKAHGKVATQRENTRSTDKTAKYDVRIHAAQQAPTEGMSKLMDLLASTVEPIKMEKN